MQSVDVKSESRSKTIETLEGVAYELRPCNPYRWRLKAGSRARLFVAEMFAYVPEGEFYFVQDGSRYRLKLEGPVARTLVYMKLRNGEYADRQRERYYRPVRIVAVDEVPQPPRERIHSTPERPISAEERELVDRLLPLDFPSRERVIAAGSRATVRSLGKSILIIGWPGEAAACGRVTEFTLSGRNASGVAVSVALQVSRGVPSGLVCRLPDASGFAVFPSADSLSGQDRVRPGELNAHSTG